MQQIKQTNKLLLFCLDGKGVEWKNEAKEPEWTFHNWGGAHWTPLTMGLLSATAALLVWYGGNREC